jgi:CopG-like RHH_1 or ribbon-helix-helix domain, RHH_5
MVYNFGKKEILMGKSTNPKPRLNFTLATDWKADLDKWAEEEGRSTANLLERIVLDALTKKKQDSTQRVATLGKNTSDRKT